MTISTLVSFLVVGAPAPATLAVDGLLVANLSGKKWAVHSDTLPRWSNLTFRQVQPGKVGRKILVRKPVIMEMSGLPYLKTEGSEFLGVLWSGPTPAFPRAVAASKQTSAELRKIVAPLILERARDPQQATWSSWTVDLDGDGTKDHLVRAEMKNSASYGGLAWNIVVWVPARRTPNILAWETDENQESCTRAEVLAIADFDRDGRYEVVIGRQYIEGNSGEVWTFGAGKATKVVEKGS